MYIRLVGDIDYNQAQQYALLASRKLRKRLNKEDSVENQALFLDLDERETKDLIMNILLVEVANFREAAIAEIGDKELDLELPDTPTLEERENKQELEEKDKKERIDKLRTKMEELSNKRKEELEAMSVDEVRKIFKESSINFKCLQEFTESFRDYCIFSGTFDDSNFTHKAFTDFDEYRNASPNLKRPLYDAYVQLELTGDQLKN